MNTRTCNNRTSLILLILFILITNVAIIAKIPYVQQIFGLLFLTFLPGFLILKIIQIEKIESFKKVVMYLGVSLSFLMFYGLFINFLLPNFGFNKPLSTNLLLASLDIIFTFFLIILFIRKNIEITIPKIKMNLYDKLFAITAFVMMIIALCGINLMNLYGINVLIITFFISVPIFICILSIFHKRLSNSIYPLLILILSFSILILFSIRTTHILGVDTHSEYYFFQTTLNNLNWQLLGQNTRTGAAPLDSCVIISLVPTIYQSILNVNPEMLFKVLFSTFFTVAPVLVYYLSKKYLDEFYSFLAAFLFMVPFPFLITAMYVRSNMAILFFLFALAALFSDEMDPMKRKFLFIILAFSAILSHYATTYIFFFVILVGAIFMEFLSVKYKIKNELSLTFVLLFFAMVFLWYGLVTYSPFDQGVNFISDRIDTLGKFFRMETRTEGTQMLLGKDIAERGLASKIQFISTWLTFIFIAIGVITSLIKHKNYTSGYNFPKPKFLKNKFSAEYIVLALSLSLMLVGVISLPFFTYGYSLDRSYLLAIMLLATFFIIGSFLVTKYLNTIFHFIQSKLKVKNKKSISPTLIILLILCPYFLGSVGITGVIFDSPQSFFQNPQSILFDNQGEQYENYFIYDKEAYGAEWIANYTTTENIYSDQYGGMRLVSQGLINPLRSKYDSKFIDNRRNNTDGYFFLRYTGVVYGKIKGLNRYYDISMYNKTLPYKDKIYANGGSEIYKN